MSCGVLGKTLLVAGRCEVADFTVCPSKGSENACCNATIPTCASTPNVCSGQGVIPDPSLASEPCSTLAGGSCTTATCCSKNCVGFGDCGAEALVSTPASTSCGSAGDDCGDLSWTQCF